MEDFVDLGSQATRVLAMTPDADRLGDIDLDDPRAPSQQIAALLRAAILTRKFEPGDKLPSQHELAARYNVARDTIKAALRILDRERLIVTRQGSGAFVRAQVERAVGLRPHVEGAFARPHVSIDFAGFSGETLYNTLAEVLDKIRAGRLTPQSVRLRAMILDTTKPLVLPRPVAGDADADALRRRADRITRRSIDSLIDSVNELADLGLVKSASAEVRAHDIPPVFKAFILNNEEVFFGFYDVTEHTVTLDGQGVPIYDVLGKDSSLFHFTVNDDEASDGARYVQETRTWFESVWSSIAREYKP
jgi:DNA-binding transcriptional regulator YhcF (GntR family)